MANVDRPRGFTPVKYVDGTPWRGECRTIVPKDGADIYIGDALTLDGGTADQFASGDTAVLGVCVGVGMKDKMTGYYASAVNPDNLNEIWYDDSDHTNTDFVIYYVPAKNMIFEVQSDIDASAATVGTLYDVTVGTGSASGRSAMQLTTDSNHDVYVVELPQTVGNDPTSIWASYYVMFRTSPVTVNQATS